MIKNLWRRRQHISSSQIIILGFLAVILLGSFLLMLPCATRESGGTDFLDALFTSVSATCVTGLVVYDTATHWSIFGQIVILLLIQIGGMGVITVAVAITAISGKKIGLMQRSTMQEAISAQNVGGIVRLTGFIIKITVLVELIGALLMMPVFCREFGSWKGCWYAVFHSVSAFCNAGFDLMGVKSPCSSLTDYSSNPLINVVIMALIIIGGIGFLTWEDIKHHGVHIRKYRMQSKVILFTTVILLVFPICFYYFYEFSMPNWGNMTAKEKIWSSLFQAVAPRTAGFNSVDLSLVSEPGQLMTIVLMLIGGAPGSTAGGMKMTTIAVLFLAMFSTFRRKEDVNCFGRRITENVIKNAAAILLMYLSLFLIGAFVISCVEGLPLQTCLFETASAIGTVGLSLGITSQVGTLSHIILMVLMFLGRVGGLTLIFAMGSGPRANVSKLPQEKITVG